MPAAEDTKVVKHRKADYTLLIGDGVLVETLQDLMDVLQRLTLKL